jgi:diguanylate cyclase (GGDEF)-like protein
MSLTAGAGSRPASILDLEASFWSKAGAIALAVVLTAATVWLGRAGSTPGSPQPAFLPICATLWCTADILTAFLLLTQFYVNGVTSFAFIGAGYLFSGLLSIPYIAFFPGLIAGVRQSVGTEQVSIALWITWHIVFALVVAAYVSSDPRSRRRMSEPAEIRKATLLVAGITTLGAIVVCVLVAFTCDSFPVFVHHGTFQPPFSRIGAPLVVAVNWGVALALLFIVRRPSLLQIWLIAAIFAEGLDGLLNAWAPGRYTATWYVGKMETFLTSSLLLGILLGEVGRLYARLSRLATLDPLTGLRNRRALTEGLRWAADFAHRKPSPMSVLMIDVDDFKSYNDTYGHAAGDDCLRAIAAVLEQVAHRSTDIVARYGGEEFAVVLVDTEATGALEIGNRIRAAVESLAIPHARSSAAPVVTVSIGVGASPALGRGDFGDSLFASADRALYDAKAHGRNVCLPA